MRDFLISNGAAIVTILTLCELLITVLLAVNFFKTRRPLTLIMAVTSLALTFDAAVMMLGKMLPADTLTVLSRFRYVAHGALIPLMFMICGYVLHLKGLPLKILWGVTAAICIAGAASGYVRPMELREFAGILRYAGANGGPAWAAVINRLLTFGTVLPLIAVGIAVLIREKKPFIMLSGILMFAFSAIAPATGNADLIFLVSMFGKLLMVLCYWLHAITVQE